MLFSLMAIHQECGLLTPVPLAYWRDIHDHVTNMLHRLSSALSNLDALQNAFLAKISIDQAKQSNEMAEGNLS